MNLLSINLLRVGILISESTRSPKQTYRAEYYVYIIQKTIVITTVFVYKGFCCKNEFAVIKEHDMNPSNMNNGYCLTGFCRRHYKIKFDIDPGYIF